MRSPPILLAAEAVSRRFGAVQALDRVSIDLAAGEVHAILGENGAGKSTLARLLTGSDRPDAGRLLLAGRPASLSGRAAATAAGIGYVPQTPALVGSLTLAENMALGGGGPRADRKAAARRLEAAFSQLGLSLPSDKPVVRFDVAERQLGEIAIALAEEARILVLDEPTAALAGPQIDFLVAILRRLAASGRAIALVTHRIVEVLQAADRITVLRQGGLVHSAPAAGLDAAAVARLMIGERRVDTVIRPAQTTGAERLRLSGVALGAGQPDIDLSVRGGEIVGIAGLAGEGQAQIAEILAGVHRPARGLVAIDGHDVTGRPREALERGLAWIPEDRDEGLAGRRSLAENASLMRLREAGFRFLGLRRPGRERAQGDRLRARLGVVAASSRARVGGLSGGNRQKLLVGRELDLDPAVLVAHGPTQGLDIAAAGAIRAQLAAAAEQGAAILLISRELDELLALSHRILVLARGRLTAEFDCRTHPPAEAAIGLAMAGTVPLET